MVKKSIFLVIIAIVFTGCVSVQEEDSPYVINGEIKFISENSNNYEIKYDSYPEYMKNNDHLMIRFLDGTEDLSGTGKRIQFESNKLIVQSGVSFKFPDNKNLNVMILFDNNNNFLPDKNEVFYIIKGVSKSSILSGISFEIGTNIPIVKINIKENEEVKSVSTERNTGILEIRKSEQFEYRTEDTHSFFQIFGGSYTYEEAEKKCNETILVYKDKEYSGQMIYFNNKEETDFFFDNFKKFPLNSWMGLFINEDSEYEWINGKLLKDTYSKPFSRELSPDPKVFTNFSKVRGWMGVNIDDKPFYWSTRYNNHTIGYTVRWDINE